MLLATRLLVSAYLWAGVGAISGFAFEHGYVFGMAAGLVIADLDHRDSLLHHSFPLLGSILRRISQVRHLTSSPD